MHIRKTRQASLSFCGPSTPEKLSFGLGAVVPTQYPITVSHRLLQSGDL